MAMLLYLLVYLAYCNFVTGYKAECNELRFQDKTFELAYISLTNANTRSVVRQALSVFLSISLIIYSTQTRLVVLREIKFVHFRLCVYNYDDNI